MVSWAMLRTLENYRQVRVTTKPGVGKRDWKRFAALIMVVWTNALDLGFTDSSRKAGLHFCALYQAFWVTESARTQNTG